MTTEEKKEISQKWHDKVESDKKRLSNQDQLIYALTETIISMEIESNDLRKEISDLIH